MPMFRNNKKQINKTVSFGDTTEKQIETIPLEESAAVWYSSEELAGFQNCGCDSNVMECSEESWLHAKVHVQKLANKCRTDLDKADGYWDPKMAKDLSRMSLAASKGHRNAAVKRARNVNKEAYANEVFGREPTKKSRRNTIQALTTSVRRFSIRKSVRKYKQRRNTMDTDLTELTTGLGTINEQ